MKLTTTILLAVAVFGFNTSVQAKPRVVAKCSGFMLPDEIKDGEITWQMREDFKILVQKDSSGKLEAKGGWDKNRVHFTGDDVVRNKFSKEQALLVLAQFQMVDEESGLPFNVFGIDPGLVESGVHYTLGSAEENSDDASRMALFVFRDKTRKVVGKLMQVGLLLGTCKE